jgi:septum site-determining protein MinC
MADACFQMKSSTVATVVLEIHHFVAEDFFPQLQQKIESAPMFFQRAAVVFDLSCFDAPQNGTLQAQQLEQLVVFCREQGLQPIACKGADDSQHDMIYALGLASLPASKARKVEIPKEVSATQGVATQDSAKPTPNIEDQAELPLQAASAKTEPEAVVEVGAKPLYRPSKIVTKPVRSGQQIYAEGADLILMAQVSEGAEVLADGHIHVYGTLRGRALAGVKGDLDARIFCQQLEAELVSVAGQFVLNDKIRENCWKKPAQIYLHDKSIQIEEI